MRAEDKSLPFLSICIPTYNRAGMVSRLVAGVLRSPCPDIEVLVLDNASTDDTRELLAGIGDERLVSLRNPENRGVFFNVVNVLLRASGEYCVLLLDKDSVDEQRIEAFKAFLQRERPACGYCADDSDTAGPSQLFDAGEQSLSGIGYVGHHPTGFFFRVDLLRSIDIDGFFAVPTCVRHFLLDFVQAELCMLGKAAIYREPIFSPEKPAAAASTKSFGTNAAREEAFFSPTGRLAICLAFVDHVASLPVSEVAKTRMIHACIFRGLLAATLGYRSLLGNAGLCSHYHIQPRRVGVRELIRTAAKFYRGVLRAFPGGVVRGSRRFTRIGLAIAMLSRIPRFIARKIG